jgi:hypothetical protein
VKAAEVVAAVEQVVSAALAARRRPNLAYAFRSGRSPLAKRTRAEIKRVGIAIERLVQALESLSPEAQAFVDSRFVEAPSGIYTTAENGERLEVRTWDLDSGLWPALGRVLGPLREQINRELVMKAKTKRAAQERLTVGLKLARIFEKATGAKAARRYNPYTGDTSGPFPDFVAAALRPAGLLDGSAASLAQEVAAFRKKRREAMKRLEREAR